MSLRILVAVLFVGGCAGRQPVTTTPPPHVVWVPEARALLGNVYDDALADFDAELERLRAIARFEIETEDPDHEGVRRLLRLHRFDADDAVGRGEDAVSAAQARVMASADVLVGALMLEGREAFDVVLSLSPNLLVERPEAVNRFLRSGVLLMRGNSCGSVTRGFFLDRLSRLGECEGRIETRLAPVWGSLDPSVRASFRARGLVPADDVLDAAEASALVDVSFWGAQAYLHQLVDRGDVSGAAHLARALLARDPSDIPARLAVALEREVASGAVHGDEATVGALALLYGPRFVSYGFPESNVAKLVLLEQLAAFGLSQDFARVRGELSDASLELLGPVLDLLDAIVARRADAVVRARAALRVSDSVTMRAYALGFERDDPWGDLPQLGGDVTAEEVRTMLTLEPPPSTLWWVPLTILPSALRAQLIARVGVPLLASRANRQVCWPANVAIAACAPRVDAIEAIAPIDLDAALLRALEATPYWSAPALEAMFVRLDGGPVSARPAYVYHRIKALIFGGHLDEARRRLATEGRILSRGEALLLDAAMLDAIAGHLRAIDTAEVATIEEMFVNALVEGCPFRDADASRAAGVLAPDEVVEALRRTRPGYEAQAEVPFGALRPFLARFEGRSRQTLAMMLAFDSLTTRARAQFDADLTMAEPRSGSRVAHLFAALAASSFSVEPASSAHDWVLEEATGSPGHQVRAGRDSTSEVDPDVSALSGPALEAYDEAMETGEPEARARFLRVRATDEHVRRLQCRVALDDVDMAGWIPGYLGVEPPRALRTPIDRMVAACRLETEASPLGSRVRYWLPRRTPAPADDGGPGPSPRAFPRGLGRRVNVERAVMLDVAFMSTPADHMLARMAGLDAPLSLMLEGRHVDARRAAEGNRRDVLAVRLLSEDLEARRLDPYAALALVWLDANRARADSEGVLAHLLETNPRSKLLAFATTWVDPRGTRAAVRERRASQLIATASNDVELLVHLADAFRRGGLTSQADRAIVRVRTLEPNARTTLEEEAAADCAPE